MSPFRFLLSNPLAKAISTPVTQCWRTVVFICGYGNSFERRVCKIGADVLRLMMEEIAQGFHGFRIIVKQTYLTKLIVQKYTSLYEA